MSFAFSKKSTFARHLHKVEKRLELYKQDGTTEALFDEYLKLATVAPH